MNVDLDNCYGNVRDVVLERLDSATLGIRLYWQYSKLRADAWKAWKDMPAYKSQEDYDANSGPAEWGIHSAEEELDHLEARRLRFKAQRLGVVLPAPPNDKFFEPSARGGFLFTDVGAAHVRELMQPALKQRREAAVFWISTAIGLLGAISGLIAVISK